MAGKPKAATGKRATPNAGASSGSVNRDRIAAVMASASESGLISGKGGRISGRISPALIERAKARTELRSDTELVEFALANVALEDDFARVLRELHATVPADLDLEN